MGTKKSRYDGAWLNVRVDGLDGKHWEFYGTEKRVYVRYGKRDDRRFISTGHWLGEPFTRLQAALEMAKVHEHMTPHEVVCLIVRNDMKHWPENKTKDRFRKIVRPKE